MSRAPVPIASLGRRLPELGRIKDGVKTDRAMKAIEHLRFTSQDPIALQQIADVLGGEVKPYSDAKSDDTHELLTTSAETPVVLPPDPLGGTPMYELYSGGGRERWCDGVRCQQWRSGPDGPEPYEVDCLCAAAEELTCRPTIHLSVILPFTRLGGTWRWTTHSYNAAVELPGMVEAIQGLQSRGLTRGVLRIDNRTQTIAGQTRHFKVPVLGVDATADELASGQATLGALPAAPANGTELAPPAPAELTERVERGDVELVTPQEVAGGVKDAQNGQGLNAPESDPHPGGGGSSPVSPGSSPGSAGSSPTGTPDADLAALVAAVKGYGDSKVNARIGAICRNLDGAVPCNWQQLTPDHLAYVPLVDWLEGLRAEQAAGQ